MKKIKLRGGTSVVVVAPTARMKVKRKKRKMRKKPDYWGSAFGL